MKYDVIIIGAGPSGIFCAYELLKEKPDLKVLMIEKGRSIESRQCPKRKTKKCVNCKPCSITTGFAGAGAFSDGKLSLSPDVGGNLPEILGYEKTVELIHESDQIYLDFGADKNVYGVDKEKEIREIRRRAINANLKLIECPIRHLGTEEGYKIYSRLEDHLKEIGVEMKFNTMVNDITIEDDIVEYAKIARGRGLLALEESANQCTDQFMKSALMLIVDANDTAKVRGMLDDAISFMCERHDNGRAFFEKGVAVFPAFGMLGTVVGLVNMLNTMDSNPEGLADGMATALITTFYGSLFANVLFNPMASALQNAHNDELLCMQIIEEGVLAIADGSNPRYIQEKLEFMLPASKKRSDKAGG